MTLTDEQKSDMYPAATMETATATNEEKYYSNLPATRVALPTGYPANTPPGNARVAKVSGTTGGNKIGPAIILKVMAGDKFNLTVNSWWKSTSSPGTPVSPLPDLAAALSSNIGPVSGGHATSSELTSTGISNTAANSFLSNQSYNSARPKAFINWIVLDEQFKYYGPNSGYEQVNGSNTYSTHTRTNLTIDKSGYLYIYVSNETPNIDVFFDNLQVTHIRGPILEETHYYPFGLTMAGISSKSAGTLQNKDKTFQGQKFDDDLGVNYYSFKWRNHDPQIGRFIEIDPLSNEYVYNSTYAFSENQVIAHVELEGLEKVKFTEPSTWLNFENIKAASDLIMNAATLKVMPVEGETGGVKSTIKADVSTTIKADISTAIKTELKAGVSTLEKNVAQGAAFEKKVGSALATAGDTKIAPQITIKADNGIKTKVDFISTNTSGQIAITEAKSSATAPLTGNQKIAFPSIAQNGGVVVGMGKPGYPGGTVIPPTQVNIIRPAIADATYVKPPIPLLPLKGN